MFSCCSTGLWKGAFHRFGGRSPFPGVSASDSERRLLADRYLAIAGMLLEVTEGMQVGDEEGGTPTPGGPTTEEAGINRVLLVTGTAVIIHGSGLVDLFSRKVEV